MRIIFILLTTTDMNYFFLFVVPNMSSLLVAMALAEPNIQTEKRLEIISSTAYLLNFPSVTKTENEDFTETIHLRATGTPDMDDFDIFSANTPKKFAIMVKQNNQVHMYFLQNILHAQ